MIEKQNVIEILKAIDNLLSRNDIVNTKEYIKVEIDNLEGKTPEKCKGIFKNFKGFNSSLCNYCSNTNCPDNKGK